VFPVVASVLQSSLQCTLTPSSLRSCLYTQQKVEYGKRKFLAHLRCGNTYEYRTGDYRRKLRRRRLYEYYTKILPKNRHTNHKNHAGKQKNKTKKTDELVPEAAYFVPEQGQLPHVSATSPEGTDAVGGSFGQMEHEPAYLVQVKGGTRSEQANMVPEQGESKRESVYFVQISEPLMPTAVPPLLEVSAARPRVPDAKGHVVTHAVYEPLIQDNVLEEAYVYADDHDDQDNIEELILDAPVVANSSAVNANDLGVANSSNCPLRQFPHRR